MKKLLYFCLLFPSAAWAQQMPPDRANAINVQVADSGAVAWQRVAQVLTARGYAIANSSKDLLTVTTVPKPIRVAGTVAVNATVSGRQILLYGTLSNSVAKEGLRMTYRGMKGSPYRVAWAELEAIAAALQGHISYQLQP